MMSRGAGCRHTDQHFCVWGPRVACVHTLTPQFLPCSGWAALLLVWSLVPSCPHGRRCPGQRGWEDARPYVPQRPVESLSCWVSTSQISLSSGWGGAVPLH